MNRPIPSSARHVRFIACALLVLVALVHSSCGGKSSSPTNPTGPVRVVTPTQLSFGAVAVGDSALRQFVISNDGQGTLTGTVSESSPVFRVLNAPAYELGAGQSVTYSVRYVPSAVRSDTCLVLTGGATVTCIGSGRGAPCEVSPETLQFYRRTPDQRIAFTIRNAGTTLLAGTVHSPSPEFRVLFDSTYSLAPGQDKLFQVSFKPAGPGVRSCVISTGLAACAGVVCTGIGPRLTVSPASLDLGDSWHQVDKAFTVTNADSFPLTVTLLPPCGPFGLRGGSRTLTLAPGQSLRDSALFFPPNSAGSFECQFDLGISTAGVVCRGTSVHLDERRGGCAGATVNFLDFGTVAVGQSVSRTLTILAGGLPDPNEPLCSGVVLEYADDLTLSPAVYSNLSPGDEVQVTVTVTPTQAGMHHMPLQVWCWKYGQAHNVSGYVECRVAALPASPH